MKKFAFIFMILAACSSKPEPDPNIALCPEKTIKILQDNQQFFSTVVLDTTPVTSLKKRKGLVRRATLEKAGETDMNVLFYMTNLPRCPWLVGYELPPRRHS